MQWPKKWLACRWLRGDDIAQRCAGNEMKRSRCSLGASFIASLIHAALLMDELGTRAKSTSLWCAPVKVAEKAGIAKFRYKVAKKSGGGLALRLTCMYREQKARYASRLSLLSRNAICLCRYLSKYYINLNPGQNVGQQPNDYVDVVHGSYVTWETPGSVTFGTGTTVHWSIFGNAQDDTVPTDSSCGTADNGYEHF